MALERCRSTLADAMAAPQVRAAERGPSAAPARGVGPESRTALTAALAPRAQLPRALDSARRTAAISTTRSACCPPRPRTAERTQLTDSHLLAGLHGLAQAPAVFLDAAARGPSQRCTDVMRQVVEGLAALHERGIVHRGARALSRRAAGLPATSSTPPARATCAHSHPCLRPMQAFALLRGRAKASDAGPDPACVRARDPLAVHFTADLKPHNVLLTETGRAKLSDMGLSKQLVAEQSSFESHGAGGSSGWQVSWQLAAPPPQSAQAHLACSPHLPALPERV